MHSHPCYPTSMKWKPEDRSIHMTPLLANRFFWVTLVSAQASMWQRKNEKYNFTLNYMYITYTHIFPLQENTINFYLNCRGTETLSALVVLDYQCNCKTIKWTHLKKTQLLLLLSVLLLAFSIVCCNGFLFEITAPPGIVFYLRNKRRRTHPPFEHRDTITLLLADASLTS